jgi:hypothetical protein
MYLIERPAMRKLLTVEDSFQISGRGLVVVPCPKIDKYAEPEAPQVELRCPTVKSPRRRSGSSVHFSLHHFLSLAGHASFRAHRRRTFQPAPKSGLQSYFGRLLVPE